MCFPSLKKAKKKKSWLVVYLLFWPSDRAAAALFSSSVMFCSVNVDTSETLHFSITTISISAKHKHNTDYNSTAGFWHCTCEMPAMEDPHTKLI